MQKFDKYYNDVHKDNPILKSVQNNSKTNHQINIGSYEGVVNKLDD